MDAVLIMNASAKELAVLVLGVQGRQADVDEVVQQLTDGLNEAISSVRTP